MVAAGGLAASHRFLGLVEPLNCALGLGVSWGTVLLVDAQFRYEVLEAVSASGES